MRLDEYIVADHFESKGFTTQVSQYSNDYGVDVFATKGKTNALRAINLFFNPLEVFISDDSPNHKFYRFKGAKRGKISFVPNQHTIS